MRGRQVLGSSLSVVVGLALWRAVSVIRVAGRPLVAAPEDVARALPSAWGTLASDLWATTSRAAMGLAIGVASGVAIGVVGALAVRRAPLVEGMLDFSRSVPPVVLLPVFLLAFGYDDTARVATIAAGVAWTMALAVTTAAAAPRSSRREMLRLAGASAIQAVLWTQPWEALPALTVGLRSSTSTAVIVAVVTEIVAGAERGVGARVVSAQIASDTTALTVNVLAIGVVGYLANVGLRRLEVWARRLS